MSISESLTGWHSPILLALRFAQSFIIWDFGNYFSAARRFEPTRFSIYRGFFAFDYEFGLQSCPSPSIYFGQFPTLVMME